MTVVARYPSCKILHRLTHQLLNVWWNCVTITPHVLYTNLHSSSQICTSVPAYHRIYHVRLMTHISWLSHGYSWRITDMKPISPPFSSGPQDGDAHQALRCQRGDGDGNRRDRRRQWMRKVEIHQAEISMYPCCVVCFRFKKHVFVNIYTNNSYTCTCVDAYAYTYNHLHIIIIDMYMYTCSVHPSEPLGVTLVCEFGVCLISCLYFRHCYPFLVYKWAHIQWILITIHLKHETMRSNPEVIFKTCGLGFVANRLKDFICLIPMNLREADR